MKIDRCICANKQFSELLEIALKNDCTSISEVQSLCDFGKNCKRCLPYISQMLKTHQCVFYDIIEKETT